jgi:hypothetical protein
LVYTLRSKAIPAPLQKEAIKSTGYLLAGDVAASPVFLRPPKHLRRRGKGEATKLNPALVNVLFD